MERHRRSVVKAVTYRLFATSIVFGMAFVFTGHLGAAAKIGASAAVAKTTLYYLWERLWSNIGWGVEGA
ncbi:MAG: DUF2061 domain-containing protein [Halobacteriales archaeon]